jgi:hypothetical protein
VRNFSILLAFMGRATPVIAIAGKRSIEQGNLDAAEEIRASLSWNEGEPLLSAEL